MPHTTRRLRLGFLGVGWIGRHRLEAVVRNGRAEVVAVADASPEALTAARELVPAAQACRSLAELLEQELDGLVIATPSALHAEQAIAGFRRGLAVFCQKPLARTAEETRRIVAAAREADRLLAVDLSYRCVRGVSQMRELIQSGELGHVYAVDLTFHNAYGPDKAWFYDPKLAGGGCLIDLGTHLVDLSLWMFGFPNVTAVQSRLFREGRPVRDLTSEVEDCALATWDMSNGTSVRLACSWRLPAGCDAVISASFYGTQGAVALQNVNGSFYDFVVQRFRGTARETLAGPPDDWGGRAIVSWCDRLARSERFDAQAEDLVRVATVLDAVYRP